MDKNKSLSNDIINLEDRLAGYKYDQADAQKALTDAYATGDPNEIGKARLRITEMKHQHTQDEQRLKDLKAEQTETGKVIETGKGYGGLVGLQTTLAGLLADQTQNLKDQNIEQAKNLELKAKSEAIDNRIKGQDFYAKLLEWQKTKDPTTASGMWNYQRRTLQLIPAQTPPPGCGMQ